ncbi:MAG TPA: rRNA maturation RNase YbeY [Verrucomicrobiae bacterium]|jgi:probable rRNA maturation factor
MNLIIANRQGVKKIDLRSLKKITTAVLAELKIADAMLEINLLGAKEMAALNETFLHHDGPTDVITFDYASAGSKLHGEIFICVDVAVLQAKEFETHWQSEIVRYVVHGVLHLLGHDDTNATVRQRMKREENRLMRKLAEKFSLAQISRPPKLRA